jgi:hypothetical protein
MAEDHPGEAFQPRLNRGDPVADFGNGALAVFAQRVAHALHAQGGLIKGLQILGIGHRAASRAAAARRN